MPTLTYHRILLKLSGEALMGKQGYGIDADMLQYIASEIHAAHQLGGQLALVIGGGEHLSRHRSERVRHRTSHGRLYGHAGNGH